MTSDEAAPDVSPKALKHLNFVQTYGQGLANGAVFVVGKAYTIARPYVPKSVDPLVTKAEDTFRAYSAPLAAKATDGAEKLLLQADEQVDYIYLVLAKILSLEPLRELHKSNMAAYQAGADKYFNLVQSTSDHVAAKLQSVSSVQSARQTLAEALEKAKELADPDAAVQAAYAAWSKFAAIPAVAKTLEAASPLTDKGLATFYAAHDVVVGSPAYKRSLSLGASTLGWATTTTPYKLGAAYLYPLVQPLADPALDKVAHSAYVNQALQYWAPVAAA